MYQNRAKQGLIGDIRVCITMPAIRLNQFKVEERIDKIIDNSATFIIIIQNNQNDFIQNHKIFILMALNKYKSIKDRSFQNLNFMVKGHFAWIFYFFKVQTWANVGQYQL